MTGQARRANSQGGYTLVELIITLALSGILMVALTSVVLTTWRATSTASDRLQASSQIRNFQYFAYDDFARSGLPSYPVACGTVASNPCSQPIQLTGTLVSNAVAPVQTPGYSVVYSWDETGQLVYRQAGSSPPIETATNVSAFAWYIDSSSGFATVVLTLTVTVEAYSESQTFRFYPRLNP